MRVNKTENSALNFKGAMNNKILLSGLEKISEHGASFVAGTSFASALLLRPLAISLTPGSDKKNKETASASSISSGLIKLLMVEAVALPVEGAIKQIDKNPDMFLKKETIDTLKGSAKSLTNSREYKFATQCLKLGGGLVSAIPKSVLTVALIPLIMDKVFNFDKKKNEVSLTGKNLYDPVFKKVTDKTSFEGAPQNKIASGIGKILDNENVLKFVRNNAKNDANTARNMSVATDMLLTATSTLQIKKSKKIEEDRKNPLIYNNVISTASSILFGCTADKLVQKSSKPFMDKFVKANSSDPKLMKYVEGLNILRPTLIFGLIYYGILPVISTFFADKIDKKQKSSQ